MYVNSGSNAVNSTAALNNIGSMSNQVNVNNI